MRECHLIYYFITCRISLKKDLISWGLRPAVPPEIKEGSFELDLGFVKLEAKLSEDDRQCAWELPKILYAPAVGKNPVGLYVPLLG